MVVGVYKVSIHIPASLSLKAKRRVVKSLIKRLQNQFNIAAAEVENQDQWQIATLGMACVSNDTRHAQALVANIKTYLEEIASEFELLDEYTEMISINHQISFD